MAKKQHHETQQQGDVTTQAVTTQDVTTHGESNGTAQTRGTKASQANGKGTAPDKPARDKPAPDKIVRKVQGHDAVVKARAPRYDFHAFEEQWRARWEERGTYRVNLRDAKRPYYNLMMFPYPSAEGLHVGNVYAFVGSDIHGRFMAAQGYDVFEPMGFDAFGIHSENFAIKQRMHPAVLTARNVERFREQQLKRIGNRYDWSHEVNTTDPRYYKWTQWIFTQLFNAGLAEHKRAAVNWCPNDKTVLADEQVINGRCERCDALVERRELEQWFLKTTAYADRLLANLPALDWSERVKVAQRNWIGRSEGLECTFQVAIPEGNHRDRGEHKDSRRNAEDAKTVAEDAECTTIRVYTTRPDTIYGATFVVLAPEHPAVDAITSEERREAVAAYRREAAARRAEGPGERAVTGVFTGAYTAHPLTGEPLPVWVADYVLMDYGTGAIMAVPAHDERDLAFARAFGLPVRVVVVELGEGSANELAPQGPTASVGARPVSPSADADPEQAPSDSTVGARPFSPVSAAGDRPSSAFTDDGVLVDSGPYTGMTSQHAREAIIADFEARGIGRREVHYQMRDWLISRQRYWGAPIPIVYCPQHGAVAVPEEQLPVLLPPLENYVPTATGNSPLAQIPEFVNTTCPVCGKPARRETDVMDNFVDSGWYYLRYPSTDDQEEAWDPELTRKWLPVSMYIGGAEHSVLHLLYSRFLTMALHDLGNLSFEEPFAHFRAHGLIITKGAKISKSRGNVINPDDYLETYGADVLRTYLMFMGPYEAGGEFSDRGIGGIVRFLDRVWRLSEREVTTERTQITERGDTNAATAEGTRSVGSESPALKSAKSSHSSPSPLPSVSSVVSSSGRAMMHATIKRVSEEIAALKYNTAIAGLMEYTNALEAQATVSREELRTLLVLLAPFAPYLSEELWQRLGESGSVHHQAWPVADEAALVRERMTLVVQVDGRLRDRIELPAGADAEQVRTAVLASEKVQRATAGRVVRDVIYVPGRLANVVTAGEVGERA